jgi:hypothetical protein
MIWHITALKNACQGAALALRKGRSAWDSTGEQVLTLGGGHSERGMRSAIS